MSQGETRFKTGQSGNPKGRPRKRDPHASTFDVIFDQVLTVKQNGLSRDLTVDEALELQIYHAALAGNRMARRQVAKMIDRRDAFLAKREGPARHNMTTEFHHPAENANEAMLILGIAEEDQFVGAERPRLILATWATQAALSRPGRRKFDDKKVGEIKMFTSEADKLSWPRGRIA